MFFGRADVPVPENLVRSLLAWLKAFWPAPLPANLRERSLSGVGALLGLLVTEIVSRTVLGASVPWFIAPMGASAVLLFAVPTSPLAQPWSIVGGNVLSALVGVGCAHWIDDPTLAAALAGGLAIILMFQLRCLHPPGGAVALTSVLGGAEVEALGFGFALVPVALNSLLLLLMALLFNAAMHRRYPQRATDKHPPGAHHTADALPGDRLGVRPEDLQAVLEERGEMIDISNTDLEEILLAAERRAWRRRFGDMRCTDVMSHDVVTIAPSATLEAAWSQLAHHRLKALPVVEDGRLVGIVTMHDFLLSQDLPWRSVEDAMTREVVSANPEQLVIELVPTFSDQGIHHVPIVDADRRVIGMLTQSDLVAALFRAGLDQALASR